VTIARRHAALDGIAAPTPAAPTPAAPAPASESPQLGTPVPLGDVPAPEVVTPVGRLRRCTYRRVDLVEPLPARPALPTYEVMCLYWDPDGPLPLGDVPSARPVCEACQASGIFRPDED
jgi:hypothetical protein